MLATLSRWRPWVQVPSRALKAIEGTVRQPAERPSSNLGALWVRLPPVPVVLDTSRVGWAWACPGGRNPPAFGHCRFDSCPTHSLHPRTTMVPGMARWSIGKDTSPSSWSGGFDSRTGYSRPRSSRTIAGWRNGRRASLRSSCPFCGLGSSSLPSATWPGGQSCKSFPRRGRRPVGSHKADSPGSIPGPGTRGRAGAPLSLINSARWVRLPCPQ